MKLIVVLIACLATLKVAAREHLFHAGASDVIVAAYRERAADACQRDPRTASFGVGDRGWSTAAVAARVGIGKAGIPVHFWQTEHAKWDSRFRNPYLFIDAIARGVKLVCEYDIVNGAVTIQRL
jgi:hypothetical protein